MENAMKCHQCGQDTQGTELSPGTVSAVCGTCWEELQAATKTAAKEDLQKLAPTAARKRPR